MSDETKKAAQQRLYKAQGKLYRVREVLDATSALLSAITGMNAECAQVRDLRRHVTPIIESLRTLMDSGRCDLDETMQSILRQKSKGKARATGGGTR